MYWAMTNDPSPAGIHHVRVTQTESPCVLRQSSSLMPSDCMDTCLSKLVCSLLSLSAAQVSKFNNWTPSFGDFLHVYIFLHICCFDVWPCLLILSSPDFVPTEPCTGRCIDLSSMFESPGNAWPVASATEHRFFTKIP